ncbi:MAG: hypothetical protein Q8L40_04835 [Burkholderiales bacterium]|nr:hypothetical protein [Burkholderiales bacterium]MDP2238704.1 hypothetical protein [Burkholderiales bacterium]
MLIGMPREIKNHDDRAGIMLAGVASHIGADHVVHSDPAQDAGRDYMDPFETLQ